MFEVVCDSVSGQILWINGPKPASINDCVFLRGRSKDQPKSRWDKLALYFHNPTWVKLVGDSPNSTHYDHWLIRHTILTVPVHRNTPLQSHHGHLSLATHQIQHHHSHWLVRHTISTVFVHCDTPLKPHHGHLSLATHQFNFTTSITKSTNYTSTHIIIALTV